MSRQSAPECVGVSGPLAKFADGFRVDLLERGYSRSGARGQMYLLAHVSRWMETEGLEPTSLTAARLEQYFAWRRRQGFRKCHSPLSLRTVLGYLDGLGVLPANEAVASPVDRLVEEFRDYLLLERGAKASTAGKYESTARMFLSERFGPLEDGLARVSGAEVSRFVLRESRRRSVCSTELVVCALRALLRFLHVKGLIAEPLVQAVPSVARRREDLPRGLGAGQVEALLDSCDRSTPTGRRDYAILVLLARLGLRCSEVAALQLDDIDWRASELVIRGKGSRLDRLPVTSDVGEALADYLRGGRLRGFGRSLFLTVCAPISGITRRTINHVMRSACLRAGITPVGTHRLRHTVACELLRHGAGLVEIGQVLRHQNLATTAIYARVDRQALSRLALPWPGSER